MTPTPTCSWCARTHTGGPERCLVGVLLVCGGRDYADRARVWQVLDRTARRVEITAVRHGAATGADSLAGEWAVARGYTPDPCPADWYPARLGYTSAPIRYSLEPDNELTR